MEPKGTMKDDELASLPTTTWSINNLSNDSAVSETESDHHFPTFKHVKKLINNAIQTTVTNIERFFTDTKTHVDQLEQKVEHDHHQLQELVVEQNRKLNEKIDNQYSLIAGLIENHYKFSQKINHMVICLDEAATEIQKVKSVIPKPDYHHLNQICDTLEELRDDMNCIKSECLTEYAFDTANALRGDVSSTKQKVTDIIGTIKILQNNINASTSRINDLTTIVNELHPIKSNEIITTLQQKMENATSLLTSVESEIKVLAAKVYDNTDTYLLDTRMSKFEKNIEEKLEIIKTKLQLIETKNNNTTHVAVNPSHPHPAPVPSTPQPPVFQSIHNDTSPLNPIDLTSFIESTSQIKPSFPQFNKKLTISKWKSLCILELTSCKNTYYQSFVIQDDKGHNIIDPNLSRDKKASFYSLIHHALPPAQLNLEFINEAMIETANGIAL